MILTEEYLESFANKNINYSIQEQFKLFEKLSHEEDYDIFISHSSLDKKLVYSLYELLRKDGLKVYVDYYDAELNPRSVSEKTGEHLRKILEKCKCLAYVATDNAIKSKWCPWELGLFDGISSGRCCILPVMKKEEKNYNGQDYLGMYPYLSYEPISGSNMNVFWVNDPQITTRYVLLKKWIEGWALREHS